MWVELEDSGLGKDSFLSDLKLISDSVVKGKRELSSSKVLHAKSYNVCGNSRKQEITGIQYATEV